MQFDLLPETVHLQSVDPSRNRARFYSMAVVRDLFGAWVLVKAWGRIGSKGREASQTFASASSALDAMDPAGWRLHRVHFRGQRRQQHGAGHRLCARREAEGQGPRCDRGNPPLTGQDWNDVLADRLEREAA